jgi:hypothetical protein
MRSSAANTRLAWLPARHSRRKRELRIGRLGRTLAVFNLVGDYAQRQHLDPRNSFIPSRAIRHHTGQHWDRGEKAAIILALDFDFSCIPRTF